MLLMGRPTVNPEVKRDKTIGISVTKQQYEDLKTLSEMDGEYISKLLYPVITKYIDDNKKSIQLFRESKQARVKA